MFDLAHHTHLLCIGGSRAYGTHTEASDIDVKGVAIPPASAYFGVLQSFEQADSPDEIAVFDEVLTPLERTITARTKLEGSVYEVRKFIGLAMGANPNILDVLFCREEEVRLCTPLGRRLRDARELFVSAACRHTYAGYAASQLGRIQRHYRWHNDGPAGPPSRADYDLPESLLLPRAQLQAAEAAIRKQIDTWELDLSGVDAPTRIAVVDRVTRKLAELELTTSDALWAAGARRVGLDDNLIEVMRRERSWRSARGEWKRYQGWKKNRNTDRAALEVEHGYDTKHGSHLVRLLRMGIEVLETGAINVWRGDLDADELLAIRNGAWSYERLITFAEEQQARLDSWPTELLAVPKTPDRKAINALCVGIVEDGLRAEADGSAT